MNKVTKVDGYEHGWTYLYDVSGNVSKDRAQYVVLYHRGCADGVGAAWAVHQWLSRMNDVNAQAIYIGVQYDTLAKDLKLMCEAGLFHGANVLVVDFSIGASECKLIHSRGALCIDIYDHHKTAREKLAELDDNFTYVDVVYNELQSGAVITWHELMPLQPVPTVLRYIQDRDLWQFKYPETRAFTSAFFAEGLTFETLDAAKVKHYLETMLVRGDAIEQAKMMNVKQSLGADLYSTNTVVAFNGTMHTIGLVNVPYYLGSDTAHALLDRHPEVTFAMAYFIKGDGTVSCSCRSRGDFDVSEFAQSMGGGGHAAAAGFTIPVDQFFDWFLGTK